MQSTRTTTRRRSRALLALGAVLMAAATGVLAPAPAAAAPGTAAEAAKLVQEAATQLTAIGEQVQEAELIVAAQQQAAATAADQAAAARASLAVYEPQLRAIAQSGYTGKTQSRVAAFLTSESAAELVQQMTTLDMIAAHTNTVVTEVAAARAAAEQVQAEADAAAATAKAGLDQLAAQQAEVEKLAQKYQADFDRLTAAEQATVTAAVAGRSLQAPDVAELPVASGSAAGDRHRERAGAGRRPVQPRRLRPGRLRLLRPDLLRLRGGRGHPAALEPVAVHHGPSGLPVGAAARRPGLLLHADQPRGPLHRQRHDRARPHLRVAGRRHERRPEAATASASASPAENGPRSVDAAALGQHLHEARDPLRPRRVRPGGVHTEEDGVPVGPVQ